MSVFEGQAGSWIFAAPLARGNGQADASAAIEELVEEYSTTLYRVAYSVVRNAADAEDAVQETFLRVLRHQEKLSGISDMRVWLVRITWNVVLDRKRRSKARPETDDISDLARSLAAKGPSAEAEAMSSEQYRHILILIGRLPAKERDVLLLSAVDELSTPQIAAVLSTTESSVRSRIFRARRQLGKLLDEGKIRR